MAVVERDERAVGASVRNFGHVCTTAQDGEVLAVARTSRERWLALAPEAGFWLAESGTVVVARAADEMAVLEEFASARDGDAVILDRAGVAERANVHGDDVVGGALLPMDLRVDARDALPALARWVAAAGADIHWGTNVVGVEPGLVRTSRGDIPAGHVVVAVGHDLDRLMPDVTARAGVERCLLQMLAVAPPAGRVFPTAVLTGTSLLRYGGLASCPSAADVRARLAADQPELLEHAVNLMFTQRPTATSSSETRTPTPRRTRRSGTSRSRPCCSTRPGGCSAPTSRSASAGPGSTRRPRSRSSSTAPSRG